ncbi:hypothetical protein ACFE04_011802 [Oxalis oulophora]
MEISVVSAHTEQHHHQCQQEESATNNMDSALHELKASNEEESCTTTARPSLLSLQVPDGPLESSIPDFTRVDISSVTSSGSTKLGLPPRPHSTKSKSSLKLLLSQKSFKAKGVSHDCDKTVLIIPDTPLSDGPLDKAFTSRSFSLNRIFSLSSTKAANSLPITPISNSCQMVQERHLNEHSGNSRLESKHHMTRSFSVPVDINVANLRQTDFGGGLIRVISSTRRLAVEGDVPSDASTTEITTEDFGEDIPEEEAVCRICLVELSEGGDALKMECSCKGDLALAHQQCAVKWFSIKGNKTCDVCMQDVRNLSVMLLKLHNPQSVARRLPAIPITQQREEVTEYRVWQDVPVLVMVSLLAYFCFLEQLLVSAMGPRALAISIPFACILGLFSSMIAFTMVSRSFIWAYASFQFAIVIMFAHIFYTVLNVSAILSVLLSSFTGFGIAISTNSLLMEYLRWKTSRATVLNQQNFNIGLPHRQQTLQQQDQQRQTQEHQLQNQNNDNFGERSHQGPSYPRVIILAGIS